MAENASAGSGNSNSELEPQEEEHRLNRTEKKKKSKKRKNKDIEERKESTTDHNNVTRLLYNETPSDECDEEKSESVLPSPKRVKPPPFSKVWTNEDEISLLTGMTKFKEQTGRDAGQNMAEFRAFILESLTLQATLVQLREKIRRLREKYEKSFGRGNASRTLHEVELFQLCDKIWTQPNSSGTGQQNPPVKETHNIPENGQPEQQNLPVKEKQNIPKNGRPEQKNIPDNRQPKQPEIGRARQPEIEQHKIIPETGLDGPTMEALFKRVSKDIELVTNSKACLHGNKKEVDIRVLDLFLESIRIRVKVGTLVQEKATSPELRNSPELLEQVVLRAYLEAKIKHAQLLLNAYNSFIKDHSDETQSSVSAMND